MVFATSAGVVKEAPVPTCCVAAASEYQTYVPEPFEAVKVAVLPQLILTGFAVGDVGGFTVTATGTTALAQEDDIEVIVTRP